MKTLSFIRRAIQFALCLVIGIWILSMFTPHRVELLIDFIVKGWPLILCVMFSIWGFYYHTTRSSK